MENVHVPALSLPTVTRVRHCIAISGLPPLPQSIRLDDCQLMSVVHSYKHLLTHGCRAGKTASIKQRKTGTLDNDEFELPIGYTSMLYPQPDNTTELRINIIRSTAAKAIIRMDINENDAVEGGIIITSAEPSHDDHCPEPELNDDDPDHVGTGLPATGNHPESQEDIIEAATESPKDIVQDVDAPDPSTTPRPFRINGDWMQLLGRFFAPKVQPEPEIRAGFREMTPAEVEKYLDLYCGQCAKSIEDYLFDVYTKAMSSGVQPDYLGLPQQLNP